MIPENLKGLVSINNDDELLSTIKHDIYQQMATELKEI